MNDHLKVCLVVAATNTLLLAGFCINTHAYRPAETNAIGIGAWSEPVADAEHCKLRGRLLVYPGRHLSAPPYDERASELWEHARVYLELEHVHTWGWFNPIEFFNAEDALRFELHDRFGKPAIPGVYDAEGRAFETGHLMLTPKWITIPCDARARLRVDFEMVSASKPAVLTICTRHGGWILPTNVQGWVVPANPPGDYFLSAIFKPSTNHLSELKYHMWRGTLKLPPVKITTKKP